MSVTNKNIKNKIFSAFQTLGPSLVTGIAVIPLGGLLLGLGAVLSNATFIEFLPFLSSSIVVSIATLFTNIGNMIINNLPVIFALSVSMSYCKKDAVAPFSALLGFLAMHTAISQIMGITPEVAADWTRYSTVLGIPTLNIGVLGGIICGLMAVLVYKKFKDIQLPMALSFFQGKRFVPIATIAVCILVAFPVCFIWPSIQNVISFIGGNGTVELSIFVMATIHLGCILLMPFGLHPLLYVIWAFQLGTYVSASGEVVHGLQNIFLTQLSEGTALTTTVPLTANYLLGAALIGISIAFIKEATPEKKEETKSLLMGGIFTNLVTGITEPLFFTFVFSAPILYIIMAAVVYVGEYLVYFAQTTVGTGYSGGLMDFFIYGILQNANHWWLLPIICLMIGGIMFYISKLLIRKMNLNVPGQPSYSSFESKSGEENLMTNNNDGNTLIYKIIDALGGKDNIEEIDACATRLRVSVKSSRTVQKNVFTSLGASGVMTVGDNYQIVFGTQAGVLCEQIRAILENRCIEEIEYKKAKNCSFEEEEIIIPIEGQLIPLADVKDKIFADGMMGPGFAIIPSDGNVYAPISGKVETIFPSKHAIGIVSDKGKEVLIHIGLDTVKLNGKPFEIMVEEGQVLSAGDLIGTANLQEIESAGLDTTTVIVFTNMNDYQVELIKNGQIACKENNFIKFINK